MYIKYIHAHIHIHVIYADTHLPVNLKNSRNNSSSNQSQGLWWVFSCCCFVLFLIYKVKIYWPLTMERQSYSYLCREALNYLTLPLGGSIFHYFLQLSFPPGLWVRCFKSVEERGGDVSYMPVSSVCLFIILTWKMGKLMLREVKWFTGGHTAGTMQSQCWNSVLTAGTNLLTTCWIRLCVPRNYFNLLSKES